MKNGVRLRSAREPGDHVEDIRYALERAARPKNGAQYGFYYTVIQGWNAYATGKAKQITGIKTPNAKTILDHHVRACGRLAVPDGVAGGRPDPQEVAGVLRGQADRYGLDVISSGPYMIEGSDQVSIGSCSSIKPMKGISETQLILVRNPNYNAATDSKKARQSLPDRFEFLVTRTPTTSTTRSAPAKVRTRSPSPTAKVIREYTTNASKRKLMKVNPADQTNYITMNLTQPPFDDIHVRRAMNWVVRQERATEAWGGAIAGPVAEHIMPTQCSNGRSAAASRSRRRGTTGASRRQAEMKLEVRQRRTACAPRRSARTSC